MKRRLALVVVVVSLCLGALAGPAAASDSSAPELGRLFHSRERRAQLEHQRQANAMRVKTLEGESLSIDGVVRRSGTTATVWINRQPHSAADAEQLGIAEAPDPSHKGRARLRSADGSGEELRVGETVNRATGARDDRLGGGRVTTPGTAR